MDALMRPDFRPAEAFAFTVITGPQRRLAQRGPGVFAAPFGDMMLTGCFGLVAAFLEQGDYGMSLRDY